MMRYIRLLMRAVLRRLGFGVWKIDSSETLNFENLLYILLREHEKISLLHIGAHDGKSFTDPLYNFVMQNQGRFYGVYVEPVKATYDKLIKNLGGVPGLKFLNVAVHPFLKSVDIYQLEGLRGEAAAYATGLASTQMTRLRENSFDLASDSISTTTVQAITADDCLQHLPVQAQNAPLVLCVDTEGLDFEIVRSVVNGLHRPIIIRFEHNLCSNNSAKLFAGYTNLLSYLNSVGYQVFTEHNDATAIHDRLHSLIVKPYD